MIRKYISFFIFLLALSGCSEDNKLTGTFQKDLANYLDAYNKADWERVTSMIYPRFFLAVRKEQVLNTLALLDSVGMKRNFKLKNIEKISDVLTAINEKFCRVYYNSEIVIVLNKLQLSNLEKFIEDFSEDFGKDNVVYNEKTLTFTINAHQSVIAVSDINSDEWKFMELNNEHAFDIVAQVIPKDIMKELTR